MVSSATFAAFSKPVIAKKASATPAMIAKIGAAARLLEVGERAEVGVALRRRTQTPMTITMTRPVDLDEMS